jgi:predicted lipid-binding transport protein (Tim44 family)
MQGSGLLEILLLAMVAGFLVLRLRRVLGRRTGHEPPPDRFPREADDSGDTVIQMPDRTRNDDEADADGAGPPPPPKTAAGTPSGMTQIKIADPSFNENEFVEGARMAFEMILESFAEGDKKRLKSLLAPAVYDGFAAEIDRREKAGERLETTLVSFVLADIINATMTGRKARLTLKFMTEQVNVLRSASGDVVEGDAAVVAKITDIWTFERDTRSRDPNWQLIETRSED